MEQKKSNFKELDDYGIEEPSDEEAKSIPVKQADDAATETTASAPPKQATSEKAEPIPEKPVD